MKKYCVLITLLLIFALCACEKAQEDKNTVETEVIEPKSKEEQVIDDQTHTTDVYMQDAVQPNTSIPLVKASYNLDFAKNNPEAYHPGGDIILNENVAVAIANAIISPNMGNTSGYVKRPDKVRLDEENGIWVVYYETVFIEDGVESECLGEEAEIALSKKDGRVLNINIYE